MNKVLIVTGMHRSGTSLVANWLFNAGLTLGDRLIGATPSNIYGHFEDVDIVEFHEELLAYNKTNLYQGIGTKQKFNNNHIVKAKKLIKERNENNIYWGWKQPRAALFIDLWIRVLPKHSFFILPFRNYNDVLSSLFNREFNKIKKCYSQNISFQKKKDFLNNKTTILNSYLSMWIRYNEEILKLRNLIDNNLLLFISVDNFINKNQDVLYHLKYRWKFAHLSGIKFDNIYNEKILSKTNKELNLDPILKQRADTVYDQLIQVEKDFIELINHKNDI